MGLVDSRHLRRDLKFVLSAPQTASLSFPSPIFFWWAEHFDKIGFGDDFFQKLWSVDQMMSDHA